MSDNSADNPTCCPICQVALSDKTSKGYNVIRRFECGHQFHYNCIFDKKLKSCPVCRGSINTLCGSCGKAIDTAIQIDGKTNFTCKGCLIEELYSTVQNWKEYFHWATRNNTIYQFLTSQTMDAVGEGIITKEEGYERLIIEMTKYFGFCDVLFKKMTV